MRSAPKTLDQKLILALCMSALTPLSANALLLTTSSVAFNNSVSVTGNEGEVVASNNGASFGTSTISQFDPNQGVLIGATVNLASTRTQSTWVRSTDGPNSGNNGMVTSRGTGSSTASMSGAGLDNTFSPAITNSDACSGHRREGCGGAPTESPATLTNLNSSVSSASLDSYVGGGDVTLTRTAPILSAAHMDGVFTGVETTEYSVTWAGYVDAAYDYLLHAAPSFGGSSTMLTLDLDFGTFYVGDSATLEFSLFNLPNADRTSLDLDSVIGTGDASALFTNLEQFTGLTQGSSNSWLAMLDTSEAGVFNASYLLGISDADVGAASSRFAYTLALNLTGIVNELPISPAQVNDVPEPATLALLGLGLAGLSLGRRRKS